MKISAKVLCKNKGQRRRKSRKNKGYGRRLHYASKQAVINLYGDGHFNTVATRHKKFKRFVKFLLALGIKDVNDITMVEFLEYGVYLRDLVEQEELAVKTAQEYISTVNMVMLAFRLDKKIWLSPSETVGSRSDVRHDIPAAWDEEKLEEAIDVLRQRGHLLDILLIRIIQYTGLRRKEVCLQNYKRCLAEALTTGYFRVIEGTKGGTGKKVIRLVYADAELIGILYKLAKLQGDHHSVIPRKLAYHRFSDQFYCRWQRAAHPIGLHGLHDIRSAWACRRYQQLTQCPPPVVDKTRRPAKDVDYRARLAIAQTLGHQRKDVTNAYAGGQR